MPSFTSTFGGTVIYPADVSYRAIALTANTTLTWPTELATDTDVVASIMDVTPSVGSLTIRMPDATQASVGQTALFFNVGASSFTVADNSGNTIQTIAAGEAWQIYLTGNSTINGTWRPIQYGAGTSSASASALAGAGLKAITTTLNQSAPTTLLSADYTLTSVDRARVLVWNGGAGTFTMPSAAAAGNDWFFDARNSGSGGLTVAPTGGELINGQASLVFNPGDSARIITDGSNFYTIGYGQSATFSFDYVSISLTGQPSPYTLSGTNLNRIAYEFSGILTANMQVIVPNTIQQYWIRNNTTGSYTLTVKTSGGTGVIVVQNGASILYCDGTNVVQAETASLSVPVAIAQGGTSATTAGSALVNLGGTSLGIGLFTAVSANVARAAIGAAGAGANSDITSLTGLTTPLSVAQGGTGQTTYTNGQLLIGNTTGNTLTKSTLTAGTGINIANSTGSITISGTGPDTFPGTGIAYSTGTAWGTSYTTTGTGTTLALSVSPAFTGTPTAPTAAAGTNTTQLATTAYVVGTAFSSALPGQTGNAGKYVTTDGTTASWALVNLAAGVTGTLPVANGGTGATALTLNNVLLGNGTSALQTVAPGTAGNALVSNGTSWVSQALSSASVQEFSSSGTWTKPASASFVMVEVWGAGGGGARPQTSGGTFYSGGSGGGGGSYNFQIFAASTLGSSEVVTIGAGGTGGITNGSSGATGGATNFATRLYAYGGQGGSRSTTGGGGHGGGVMSNPSDSGSGTPGQPVIPATSNTVQNMGGAYGGVGGASPTQGYASAYGGGGGGGGFQATSAGGSFSGTGGDSAYGGGGGSGSQMYKAISGSTNINMQAQAGVGATSQSGLVTAAAFGANGAFRSGGGAGAFYDFPTFTSSIYSSPRFSANNGAQVAAIAVPSNVTPFAYVSADGVSTYTPYPIPLNTQTIWGLFYDGSKYVIFSENNDGIISTTNFTTFSVLGEMPSVGANRVEYVNGYYFICNNLDLYYSTDTVTWTRANVAGGTSVNIVDIVFDGTYYYAFSSSGSVYRSTNLTSWTSFASGTSGTTSITASASAVVIASGTTPFARISTDQGATWANVATTFPAVLNSYGLTYIASQNRWFASCSNNILYTSTDGTNWVSSGYTASQIYNVLHNGTVFCAAGGASSSGIINQTSTTGTSAWTGRTSTGYQTNTGQAGGAGGLGGGGGGAGGAALTTTGNGGNGGNGFCRVYSW